MGTAPVRHLLHLRLDQLPVLTRACSVGAPTSIGDALQALENGVDLWSLLRPLVPALLGDLPDRRGHS